jgi:hypothetical protein
MDGCICPLKSVSRMLLMPVCAVAVSADFVSLLSEGTCCRRRPVGSVQAAADASSVDVPHAGSAAGRGSVGRFASRLTRRADGRHAEGGVAGAVVGGEAGFARRRGAPRACNRRLALASGNASPSLVGLLSCIFQLSWDRLVARQESQCTFCLAFDAGNRPWLRPLHFR